MHKLTTFVIVAAALLALAAVVSAEPKGSLPADTVRKLIRQLGDDAYEVRERATKQLIALGPDVSSQVLIATKESDDAEVQQRCLLILSHLQYSLPVLLAQLKDADPMVRGKAIEKMTQHGAKAIPHLEKLLSDASAEVREKAMSALLTLDPDNKKIADAAIKKATVDGKYTKLLKRIHVPNDKTSYTEFRDYGTYPATSYAGYDDIPAGYWVYVHPHWYIWGEQKK